MIRLAIDDKLLIMQSSVLPVSNWKYNVIDLESDTVIDTESNITEDYKLIDLSSSKYNAYKDKTLILEIYNSAGSLLEIDKFLISRVYSKLTQIKKIASLLGENLKKTSSNSTDFQDGFLKHEDITLYEDSALSTQLETLDKDIDYVEDFIPDARYQRQKVVQKTT